VEGLRAIQKSGCYDQGKTDGAVEVFPTKTCYREVRWKYALLKALKGSSKLKVAVGIRLCYL